MFRDELGHLEHTDLLPAAEHFLEALVGVDHSPVLGILEPVLLDVVPELLRDLGSRHRLRADHLREHGAGRHRLHESGTRFATLFRSHLHLRYGMVTRSGDKPPELYHGWGPAALPSAGGDPLPVRPHGAPNAPRPNTRTGS